MNNTIWMLSIQHTILFCTFQTGVSSIELILFASFLIILVQNHGTADPIDTGHHSQCEWWYYHSVLCTSFLDWYLQWQWKFLTAFICRIKWKGHSGLTDRLNHILRLRPIYQRRISPYALLLCLTALLLFWFNRICESDSVDCCIIEAQNHGIIHSFLDNIIKETNESLLTVELAVIAAYSIRGGCILFS